MNQAIQAAIRSQFAPVVDSHAIVISEEQLQEMKRTASLSQLYGAYGGSNRVSTGCQGKLFLIENAMRHSLR
jgi:hypothetical protein